MRVPTDRTKEWRLEAKSNVLASCKEACWEKTNKTKVIVELTVFWPDKRKRDTHNLGKEIADALIDYVYDDDYWALLRWIDFFYDKQNPRVELTIYKKEE